MSTMTSFLSVILLCLHVSLSCCYLKSVPRHQRRLSKLYSSVKTTDAPSVLCIGDALLDCIANDDARGLSVEEMVSKQAWTAFPGGAPANVATACCKLGTPSSFCGCVGADEDGTRLTSLLETIGVDTRLVQLSNKFPTRRVMVTRSLEGDREFGGFWDNRSADQFADCLLELQDDESVSTILKDTKWMVCSTLSLAFQKSGESMYQLVDRGLESGAKLLVDVNWRPVFWPADKEEEARQEILAFARRAHVVKLTDEEAEWLVGISAADALQDPKRVHDKFPKALAVLVTAGEKGAAYSMLQCTGRVEPCNVNVVETTGAGDAFTAGFLHGVLSLDVDIDEFESKVPPKEQEQKIDELVKFASVVGALTCTKEGAIAAQPTLAEVNSFLNS